MHLKFLGASGQQVVPVQRQPSPNGRPNSRNMRIYNIELLHEINATDPFVSHHLARIHYEIFSDQNFLEEVAALFALKGQPVSNDQEAPTNYSTRAVCASRPERSPPPLSYRF